MGFRRGVDFDVCDEVAVVEGLEREDRLDDVEGVLVDRGVAGWVLEDLTLDVLVVCVVVRDERLLLCVVNLTVDFVATVVV